MKRNSKEKKEYFGYLKRGSKDFACAVIDRWKRGQEQLRDHPLADRIRRAHAMYYSRDPKTGESDTTELRTGGADGEIVFADVNEFRALVVQQRVTATASPPNWAPLATNSDASTLGATRASRSILEHYRKSAGLEQQMSSLVETCLVMGVGWIGCVWDPDAGEETWPDPDTGLPRYAGDFEFRVATPFDVVIDPHSADYNRPRWMIVRRKVNRHDLAAQYPDLESEILEHGMWLEDAFEGDEYGTSDSEYDDCDDYIHVLEVYFARSPSMPAGRQAVIINRETIAYDFYGTEKEELEDPETGTIIEQEIELGLNYEEIPYFRLVQSETLMERFPYADSHDLLMHVELYQAAIGRIATLHAAKSNVLVKPRGSNWLDIQVAGQRTLEYEPGQPEPKTITLFGPDGNDFQTAEFFRANGQRQAVISDGQRGESQRGDSGSKSAFIASASQTFAAGFERNVGEVWGRIGTHVIRTLISHASTERIVGLTGIENRGEVLKFTGEDLRAISSVQVYQSNPALDSPQGRVETAFKLKQMSAPGEMDLAAFLQLARTGQVDPIDEDEFDEKQRIRREGEYLKQGELNKVQVLPLDRHTEHIKGHAREAQDLDPTNAQDQAALSALLTHIAEHEAHLTPGTPQFNPRILRLIGEEPLPPMDEFGRPLPPPGGPAGPGGGPQANGGPPGPGGGGAAPGGGPPRLPDHPGGAGNQGGPAQVQMPRPPINPGTGQPAEMPPIQNQLPAQARM